MKSPAAFIPGVTPEKKTELAFWIILHNDRILLKRQGSQCLIPLLSRDTLQGYAFSTTLFMGTLCNLPCYCGESSHSRVPDSSLFYHDTRDMYTVFDEDFVFACAHAMELLRWHKSTRFCGVCAHPMTEHHDERVKKCSHCGFISYTRISPAVMVGVKKKNEILLARNMRFKNEMFSVVAGFVDPGETLEQAAVREVYEETGISIKNLSYFSSQPWPFPDSLLIAFTAEYESGDPRPDNIEIAETAWFPFNSLPVIPDKGKISRKLIDFITNSIDQ